MTTIGIRNGGRSRKQLFGSTLATIEHRRVVKLHPSQQARKVRETDSATSEWRTHWTVALAAMVGMSFSSLAPASLGLFIQPLTEEFGWKRAQVSLGITMYALFAVPFSPLIGALIDRRGSRTIGIAGIFLSMCAFACFSLANGSTTQWLGLWICYAAVAMAIKSTVWTAAVSGLFSASRGLALAVVFCGTAISQTAAPLLARWLIDDYGWRASYLWLGFGWGGVTLVLVVLFLVDARNGSGKSRVVSKSVQTHSRLMQPQLSGLSFREALRSGPLRKIAGATVLISLLIGALIVHQVPILTERGLSREMAASLAAVAGIASSLASSAPATYSIDRRAAGSGSVACPCPSSDVRCCCGLARRS